MNQNYVNMYQIINQITELLVYITIDTDLICSVLLVMYTYLHYCGAIQEVGIWWNSLKSIYIKCDSMQEWFWVNRDDDNLA